MTVRFAPITEEFDLTFGRSVTPAGKLLLNCLRRKAPSGTPIEFQLQDFSNEYNYSLRWARAALKELVKHGLVEVIRRYYHQGFKVVVHQVGEIGKKASEIVHKTSNFMHKTSQKVPSNADSLVPTNKDIYIKTNNTVPENEQVRFSTPPVEPQVSEHEELCREAEKIGVFLNPHLKQVILGNSLNTVLNALETLKEQMTMNQVKNPAGFLKTAIKLKWTPNYTKQADKKPQKQIPRSEQNQPLYQNAQVVTPEPAHSPVPRSASAEPGFSSLAQLLEPLPRSPLPVDSPQDFSDTLFAISLSLDRLGWDKTQARATLRHQFGLDHQSLLSPEQLADWLGYLESII